MPTMRSLQFSTNCTATHLNEDPHDILQTRFVKTLFSNFDNFSHIAPEQGLSWGLLNYEADLRGGGGGPRAASASQEQEQSKPAKKNVQTSPDPGDEPVKESGS